MQSDSTPRKRRARSPEELRQLFVSTGVEQTVDTEDAATLLGKEPQTLRRWACEGSGPVRPSRVNGRLRWSVADIQRLLNPAASIAA
jgi:hypothetical protein